MKRKYNIVELFSGIGSQAKALKNVGFGLGDVYTCEWDVHPLVAYNAIHNEKDKYPHIQEMTKAEILEKLKELTLSNDGKTAMEYRILRTYSVESLRMIYSAIKNSNNFVDISSLKGESLPENIDILTYSFPCQDLSNVGAFHGYNKGIDKDCGSRSSLLWQVGRILKEMTDAGKNLPRFLLMENVPTLLAERHHKNFETWIQELQDLGYTSKYFQLNASDFGLPQNRPRLLMISVYVGEDEKKLQLVTDFFKSKNEQKIVKDFSKSEYYPDIKTEDLFRMDYSNPEYLEEALECTPNDTVSRRKIWEENPQLVLKDGTINPDYPVIRTITTKQDRNPNSGNLYFDSGIKGRSKFRYLTPRECFLFMGFTDEDYDKVIEKNPDVHKGSKLFPRDKLIRMAGNSIPVKLLEGVFFQIKKIDILLKKNGCA